MVTNEVDSEYEKVFIDAANKLKGEVLFVISGTKIGIQETFAHFLEVNDSDLPCIKILVPKDELYRHNYKGDVRKV